MIKIQTLDRIDNIEHIVVPTIFPDGTSQVWKLPEEFLNSSAIKVTWNFEREDEFFELAGLKTLLKPKYFHLHVPYLPFARQDKDVSNQSTFNLYTFAKLLNALEFTLVTSVDVHNRMNTGRYGYYEDKFPIKNFKNIEVNEFINKALKFIPTNALVYPDFGAAKRYNAWFEEKKVVCEKTRNQNTGEITGHRIADTDGIDLKTIKRVLILDDICDGGATFISIAKMLKEINPELFIDLYVTHGIFSKGKQVLYDAGIQNIYCTNSLLKNTDGFKV